jgi:hypothetical protein
LLEQFTLSIVDGPGPDSSPSRRRFSWRLWQETHEHSWTDNELVVPDVCATQKPKSSSAEQFNPDVRFIEKEEYNVM